MGRADADVTARGLADEFVRQVEDVAQNRLDAAGVYSAALRAAQSEFVCLGLLSLGPSAARAHNARRDGIRGAILILEKLYERAAGKPYDWRFALLGAR